MNLKGGTLRIIAGEFRGRRIAVPLHGTRPMADRVRESLFAVLEPRIAGAHVADLCAGSGAVGIEALSRGAARATFFEQARDAITVIHANLAALQLEARSIVIGDDVISALDRTSAPFDLIVADPPYEDRSLAERIMERCATGGGPLAESGLLALTGRARPGGLPRPLPDGLRWVRTLTYGDSSVDLLARGASVEAEAEHE